MNKQPNKPTDRPSKQASKQASKKRTKRNKIKHNHGAASEARSTKSEKRKSKKHSAWKKSLSIDPKVMHKKCIVETWANGIIRKFCSPWDEMIYLSLSFLRVNKFSMLEDGRDQNYDYEVNIWRISWWFRGTHSSNRYGFKHQQCPGRWGVCIGSFWVWGVRWGFQPSTLVEVVHVFLRFLVKVVQCSSGSSHLSDVCRVYAGGSCVLLSLSCNDALLNKDKDKIIIYNRNRHKTISTHVNYLVAS